LPNSRRFFACPVTNHASTIETTRIGGTNHQFKVPKYFECAPPATLVL
jgi:hypothetical protein